MNSGAPHRNWFLETTTLGALALALLSALSLLGARPALAQTETVLYNFCSVGGNNCTDGALPTSRLTADSAGNLYGTTRAGGLGYGTVFELSPNGSEWNETVLYAFTGDTDGGNPYLSHVIFDNIGNLYGTGNTGGAHGYGVVFKLSPQPGSWAETVLYDFAGGADGAGPENGLIRDAQGNFYGVTAYAGSGTVFQLSPSGNDFKEQVIYNVPIDGAGLVMDAAGNIFGTSSWTAFELSPNGSGGWNPKVIYTFKAPRNQSSNPEGTLVLDGAGNLYGTTGGVNGTNYTNGNVYELSPTQEGPWIFKNIFSFNAEDGAKPLAGVVFDAAGNIYGTTTGGGPPNLGTVFGLTGPDKKGAYKQTLLWNFKGPNGQGPFGSVILDSAGNLYGTTAVGGSKNTGVVFKITPHVTTALSSSANPSTYGESVTFTAVITSGAGTPPDGEMVAFRGGKTTLGTGTLSGGTANFATSALNVGTTAITAVYAGDSNFNGSTSNKVRQVVKK
jgi:uncharacterized repeat protein (TIGR03803 family)